MRRSTIETLYRLRKAERDLAQRDHMMANAFEAAATVAYNFSTSIITDEAVYALKFGASMYGENNFLLWNKNKCDQVIELERITRDARSEGQIVNARLAKAGIAFEVALSLRSTAAQALVKRQATETNRDLDELILSRRNGPEAAGSQ